MNPETDRQTPEYIDVKALAAKFGTTENAARGWCRKGTVPGVVRLGKRFFVNAAALDQYLAEQTRPCA